MGEPLIRGTTGTWLCVELCPNQNLVIIADSNPWKLKEKKTTCL